MLLYSFQSIETLYNANKIGYFTGDKNKIFKDKHDRNIFEKPYAFMCENMKARIPNYSGEYPIWAYVQKPDLRKSRYKWGKRNKCAYLTFNVPDERVLISNYELFEIILNDYPINLTKEELDYEEKLDLNTPFTEEFKRKTWQRIFDCISKEGFLKYNNNVSTIHMYYDTNVLLQACIDRVYLHEIVSIKMPEKGMRCPIDIPDSIRTY